MRILRTYFASILLLLFCCYYSSISLFSHVHIINGVSVVHSHLGGGAQHEHSESQYAVIDILSHFQTESAVNFHNAGTPFCMLSETYTEYHAPSLKGDSPDILSLRGPPQM